MPNRALLALARSDRARELALELPATRAVVRRFVPGEARADAVQVAAGLVAEGLRVTLDFLGEDTIERRHAHRVEAEYASLLGELARRGLARSAEVSVKLTALGLRLPGGEEIATAHARAICEAARTAGTTVTLDMEDHTVTSATLRVLRTLRAEFPETGGVLQAYLRRTPADCRMLAGPGSRIRLCKGAYDEPADVALRDRHEVDLAYVSCLRTLMAGEGHPMVATHDPRLVAIARHLAREQGRVTGDHEFQMLYGIRPGEQRRLAAAGETVRVYLPYGQEWWGYLTRRLAERPANLSFFVRSLLSSS
ncbi:proline dehydrogenase family protein [Nocardioides jiangxiensis]|uniref:proline dehydrogenase n=1 Tax=Nocardioides jiangxiensis TaxID=3064524 RepID=A0ABT9B4Q5_9ACTN|nr:proline dehydrogenase family protein [Nocardioides sp. WY-20]MDO7868577.1 proline dehydrogenase family protein [Nocardioides sp. WY-20]